MRLEFKCQLGHLLEGYMCVTEREEEKEKRETKEGGWEEQGVEERKRKREENMVISFNNQRFNVLICKRG